MSNKAGDKAKGSTVLLLEVGWGDLWGGFGVGMIFSTPSFSAIFFPSSMCQLHDIFFLPQTLCIIIFFFACVLCVDGVENFPLSQSKEYLKL